MATLTAVPAHPRPRALRAPAATRAGTGVPSARSVVDYTLARRGTLAEVAAGRVGPTEVCDAHPYLLRAARFHGEPAAATCPMCRGSLTHVTYTYGDCFRGDSNGRVRSTAELAQLAGEHPEFTAYVVEVCRGCAWNHLVLSFVLGTAAEA